MTITNASKKIIIPIPATAETSCCWNVVTHMFSASTSVELPGPPNVTIYTISNTLSVEISSRDTSTRIPPRILGITTEKSILMRDAPSIVAASIISYRSAVLSDACAIITENPRYCHTKMKTSQYVAALGSFVKPTECSKPSDLSMLLITPWSWYIHDQIVPVTMKDMATGYRINVLMYASILGNGVIYRKYARK